MCLTFKEPLLQIRLGSLFMSQVFLEKRIDGLKIITDVCKTCLSIYSTKESQLTDSQKEAHHKKVGMVKQVVQEIAKDGKLISNVFSKEKAHVQLVQRTEQILKLFMSQ